MSAPDVGGRSATVTARKAREGRDPVAEKQGTEQLSADELSELFATAPATKEPALPQHVSQDELDQLFKGAA